MTSGPERAAAFLLSPTAEEVLEIGGRLSRAPSARLINTAFKSELTGQLGLSGFMDWVDLAHTLVMIESGVVPPEAGRSLLQALLQLHAAADFEPSPANGDLYTNREAWLSTHSNAGHWLGAGRARREALTAAYHLKVRQGLLDLAEALTAAAQIVLARASEFSTALMPDYTYLQAAQPTTFGHYLLGFVYPLLRDLERLRGLYARVNLSPAGCGSTNGSRLTQQRLRLGERLGFEGLVEHDRDAMWQADLPIEATALVTAVLINLDRLAEDLLIFATEEFALIEFDDCHARASKIMPQKKNPFALTYIRSLAAKMIGAQTASAVVGRTPSGQPDNRLAMYGLIPQVIEDTQDAVALMGEIVALLTFNVEHARAKLNKGFVLATDLAEVLVLECGLNFRDAHRLVGYCVRRLMPDGSLSHLTIGELALAGERLGLRIELSQAALNNALDPEASVAARTEAGGAAPEAMAAMLSQCRQALQHASEWRKASSERLVEAENSLYEAARIYAGVSRNTPEPENFRLY